MPHPLPIPIPIPIPPQAQFQSHLSQLLRQYPTLSLTQLQIWLDEGYHQWHDRELGPEVYDPLEGLAPETEAESGDGDSLTGPNQDLPG